MKKYTVRISFTVPKGTKALWKAKAAAQGISMSEFLRRVAIEDKLTARAK